MYIVVYVVYAIYSPFIVYSFIGFQAEWNFERYCRTLFWCWFASNRITRRERERTVESHNNNDNDIESSDM